jgi:hypothetical protein
VADSIDQVGCENQMSKDDIKKKVEEVVDEIIDGAEIELTPDQDAMQAWFDEEWEKQQKKKEDE